MGDVLTKEQRSYNMSRIRGSNTAPEVALRRALRDLGLRGYRIKSPLPGKPDIVFLKSKIAVFVDGCFWHSCPVHGHIPKSNLDYWAKKLAKNIERAKNKDLRLREEGWTIIHYWEHDIKKDPQKLAFQTCKKFTSILTGLNRKLFDAKSLKQ